MKPLKKEKGMFIDVSYKTNHLKKTHKNKPRKHVENIWSFLRAAQNSFLGPATSVVLLQQTLERHCKRFMKFHKCLIGKKLSVPSQALEAGEKVQH